MAIVITLIIYYVTPNGFPMLVKFTVIGYLIFWFLVSFLVLSPILGICRGIRRIFSNVFVITIEANKLWEVIDKLPRREQEIIFELLERDNEPVPVMFGVAFSQYIKDWFYRDKVYGSINDAVYLKEDEYRLLKFSMNRHKKKYNFFNNAKQGNE